MDGMDGRGGFRGPGNTSTEFGELTWAAGQVIVIGATNRPDAVDPALRRPGRFDREFYFPLPNKDARKRIIGINTRKWDPRLSDDMLDRLATLTKGYGGADLRVSRSICRMASGNFTDDLGTVHRGRS
jgi:SpoVK/Ycf46/Vps4 family AAA+-type ATPase